MENSYVVHKDSHVLVVDPGGHADIIASVIDKNETVDAILLTHGHEDHTGAVDELVNMFHCNVYMSFKDLPLVDKDTCHLHSYAQPVQSRLTPVKGRMDLGVFHITTIPTPGHTHGSVCYICENLIFSGDTLFAGSIGRTDLTDSSQSEMNESLKLLTKLPLDFTVLPGHGGSTSIRQELNTNYYLMHGIL